MNEYITRTCVYYPPWESNLLRFQYYFVGVQFHWLMLMQAISLYRSRPDPRESVRNSSSVYQDTRYQDFPLIAMSGYPLKNQRGVGLKHTKYVIANGKLRQSSTF